MTVVPIAQERSNWCWASCVQMSLAGFSHPTPTQCALASLALPWQGEACGNCCGPPPGPGQVDPCNVVLDTTSVPRLLAGFKIIAQQSNNVPPLETDLRSSLGPNSFAMVLVDLGVFHYMIVCTYDPVTRFYGVANPAISSQGLISWSWPQLNAGAGMQYLWRIMDGVTHLAAN